MIKFKLIPKDVLMKLLLILILFACPGAYCAVIQVPGDQPNIQAGIDEAVDGDTVLVADGTYSGDGNRDIDFNGKAITVKSENGAGTCAVDCEGKPEDNHRGFYLHNGETESSILQGFTIQNGHMENIGGGIRCDAFPIIIGCHLINNRAYHGGGICFHSNSSTATIIDCTFTDNSAVEGAGINSSASATITNCTFTGNQADLGGGIFCAVTAATATIANSTFTGNLGDEGGGICCISTAIITNSTFNGNFADHGGGISCDHAAAVTNCTFSDNRASYGGGMSTGSFTTIFNCMFKGNHTDYAGGVSCNGPMTMTNCSIFGNSADFGGGIASNNSDLIITNCIFWNEAPEEIYGGNPPITYSCVKGGYEGVGNIDIDPLFFEMLCGKINLMQETSGHSMTSPCVDTGNDLAKNICYEVPDGNVCMNELTTRADGIVDTGTVDMGYHNLLFDCVKHGDVDFNGVITPRDALLCFQFALGMSHPTIEQECACDCDGNATISAGDAQGIFMAFLALGECFDPI